MLVRVRAEPRLRKTIGREKDTPAIGVMACRGALHVVQSISKATGVRQVWWTDAVELNCTSSVVRPSC